MTSTDSTYALPNSEKYLFSSKKNNRDITFVVKKDERLKIDEIKTKKIFTEELSDDLGLNQLSQQELYAKASTTFKKQGTSIGISDDNYLAVGSPNLVYGASTGGILMYKNLSNTDSSLFIEDAELTPQTGTTTGEFGKYSSITNDGTYAAAADIQYQPTQRVSIFKKTAGVWAWATNSPYSTAANKLCDDGTNYYAAFGSYDYEFSIYTLSGSTLTLQQTIYTSTSGNLTVFDFCNTNTVVVKKSTTQVEVYERSGTTWSLIQTININNVIKIHGNDHYLIIMNTANVFFYARTGTTGIFTNVRNYGGTMVGACVNSKYLFILTSTRIRVYTLGTVNYLSNPVLSTNYTEDMSNIASYTDMDCNEHYLTIGLGSLSPYGNVTVYKISDYVNQYLDVNSVVLDNKTDYDLDINCNYGEVNIKQTTNITGDLLVSGTVTASGANLNELTNGKLWVGNSLNTPVEVSLSGSATMTNAGVVTLNNTGMTAGNFNGFQNAFQFGTDGRALGYSYLSQIKMIDGSASAPSFSFANYQTTGMYISAASTLGFCAAGVLKAQLGPSGLSVSSGTLSNAGGPVIASTYVASGSYITSGTAITSGGNITCGGYIYTTRGYQGTPSVSFTGYTSSGLYVDTAESAGTTLSMSVGGLGRIKFCDGSGSASMVIRAISSANNILFRDSASSNCGSISSSGSTTTYGTSSDYRLKSNVVDDTGCLDRVLQLRPVKFNWNVDSSEGYGFIAHELQEIVPQAVVGDYNGVYEDGSIKAQNVDYSKIVSSLVGAIKELSTKVDTLTSRVVALETQLGIV